MEYLYKEDIILINQMTIERHGGNFVPPFNLLNEDRLDFLVEAVSGEMFGEPMYPKVYHKAGLYIFNIIQNHIFHDGCKRTGLEAALLFLKLNGYKLKNKLSNPNYISTTAPLGKLYEKKSNEELFDFVIEIASGNVTLEACQNWLKGNIQVTDSF